MHQAVVVPTAAIQHGADGSFVYVLNNNSTVSMKPVVMGVTVGQDTVVTGIVAGQSVVVEGADKLMDGVRVSVSGA